MKVISTCVLILGIVHNVLGILSICLGVTASIQADIWMAHTVSPIWSGVFFALTGLLGILCAKKRTTYVIMCFTAFSIVSLVTAVISIQLLRLGLVNETTDGETYEKEDKDQLIITGLVVASIEILLCIVSTLVSCRLAQKAKKEMERKKDGTFHVQEEDTCNKCVIYSVEKGYHNPYILQNQEEYENSIETDDHRETEDHKPLPQQSVDNGEFFNLCDDTNASDTYPMDKLHLDLDTSLIEETEIGEAAENTLQETESTGVDTSGRDQISIGKKIVNFTKKRTNTSKDSRKAGSSILKHLHPRYHYHPHHTGDSSSVNMKKNQKSSKNIKSGNRKLLRFSRKTSKDNNVITLETEMGQHEKRADKFVEVIVGDQTDDDELCHDLSLPGTKTENSSGNLNTSVEIHLDTSLNLNRPLSDS